MEDAKRRKMDKENELRAIKYTRGSLELLDQKKLPCVTHFDVVDTCEKSWEAIREMRVRGAPAIAIAAALSLAVEASKMEQIDKNETAAYLKEKLDYLSTSRPTAVNLHNAVRDLKKLVDAKLAEETSTATTIREAYIEAAEKMLRDDESDNRAIGEHGSAHIMKLVKSGEKAKMVTICNTGALATSRYGTALGVIRFLQKNDCLEMVYPLETRPYNQGSRLTFYECAHEKIPATLIVDSAASYLMATQRITACVVGADRVCTNGDTANKIGTYNLAVAAKYHNIPFYVAAPVTTIDTALSHGSGIPVEIRSGTEITHCPRSGERIVAEGDSVTTWNPAFDITPASLITGGIITELGVIEPATNGSLDVTAFLKQHNKA
ncbi:Methylthioribose-1-phosphate isomerase [Diplonema papillatum]|nr:Methylthioribose-1-phosphate isomerase [Diplonema papillatum]